MRYLILSFCSSWINRLADWLEDRYYAEAERVHFGDPVKKTGIYATKERAEI